MKKILLYKVTTAVGSVFCLETFRPYLIIDVPSSIFLPFLKSKLSNLFLIQCIYPYHRHMQPNEAEPSRRLSPSTIRKYTFSFLSFHQFTEWLRKSNHAENRQQRKETEKYIRT